MGNNLKDIRKQISSVLNTQKTTRAMKLVSTSKLKKADEMARHSKMYAGKIVEVIAEIKARVANGENIQDNPYFAPENKEIGLIDIVLITADKGLCGGFNINTIKEVNRIIAEHKAKNMKVRLRVVGKKAIEYYKFNEIEVLDSVVGLSATPDYTQAADFINKAVSDYLQGITSKIILVHNGFKNMISQEMKVSQLLPIESIEASQEQNSILEIEPSEQEKEVLNQLAKKYIEFSMYYALVDSLAAEHSARMQAMDAATNNAGELAKSLTVAYNKARQEAITTELVEINTGVESMK
ncbi:ATP synthase F1 subunit gamma [Helicobacter pullorum]|uniref:ATP synthase gamma chain n=2 Tax=Helicobacter pullorum TaxID=35818 RepID=A0A0N1EIS8_9HELI|nr:ATP synthase F1 subunit gamma [Helicobacter pullorum]HIS09541.1 F0F1 ATP synthase subunit gamma [Candidatus Scatomorpha intestinipullorum]EEQ62945.1 ATP synthase F1, gamma subunit [Helicobacter pullorum MIT 98-5489]KAB0575841.1 F0F1 ATP synthase subunit gamma [Helicobacter pullorum NCTC 12824]KPH51191.1 ATP synthase F0F1 subunit gamma [Helicobacter pullorum]KPH54116.1 ATP synthase F0F1 subunit gamma [Helicobacter pullorum]